MLNQKTLYMKKWRYVHFPISEADGDTEGLSHNESSHCDKGTDSKRCMADKGTGVDAAATFGISAHTLPAMEKMHTSNPCPAEPEEGGGR